LLIVNEPTMTRPLSEGYGRTIDSVRIMMSERQALFSLYILRIHIEIERHSCTTKQSVYVLSLALAL